MKGKRILLLGCMCVSSVMVVSAARKADKDPNIIMIMSDDQGWGDVGFNGHPELLTPNLDNMAESGVRFDRFYAAAPLCSPTRGSCLTGRYPFRFGILAAHTGGMRVGETTVAEMLKKQGYATAFFGKWHMGWVREDDFGTRGFYSPPSHHGYDEWFATTSAVPTYNPGITPKGWKGWGSGKVDLGGEPWKGGFPYVQNGEEVRENISGDDSRVIMDRVIPFIEKNKDRPFLATVWFHTPHEPVVAGEEYLKMYPEAGNLRQNYYGCITAMDDQIGRLRSELRKLGIEKNTILFFCSDNGPADPLARKGIASAGPFKGHKHTMYEGGLLVPACAEWPGVIEPGTTTEVRCSTVDFVPTIGKLAGYKFKSKLPIDGIDLMPVINGEVSERGRDLFFGYRRLYQGTDGKVLISGDYKLVTTAAKGGGETFLFDLKNDPGETTDLSKKMPERFDAMMKKRAEIETSCQLSRDGADYAY
ncbi:sulfatase-like hydrolase/transferase [Pontiellaceae bacterium B1224]|nr:sulfatase-like hydrolase/transferase [Pontiellaceae bacterium B1224]